MRGSSSWRDSREREFFPASGSPSNRNERWSQTGVDHRVDSRPDQQRTSHLYPPTSEVLRTCTIPEMSVDEIIDRAPRKRSFRHQFQRFEQNVDLQVGNNRFSSSQRVPENDKLDVADQQPLGSSYASIRTDRDHQSFTESTADESYSWGNSSLVATGIPYEEMTPPKPIQQRRKSPPRVHSHENISQRLPVRRHDREASAEATGDVQPLEDSFSLLELLDDDTIEEETDQTENRAETCPPSRPKEIQIEVFPGFFLPLRGAKETIQAIESGNAQTVTCLSCNVLLFSVPDCEMVICPDCRFLSPVPTSDDGENDAEDDDRQHRSLPCMMSSVSSGLWEEGEDEKIDEDEILMRRSRPRPVERRVSLRRKMIQRRGIGLGLKIE